MPDVGRGGAFVCRIILEVWSAIEAEFKALESVRGTGAATVWHNIRAVGGRCAFMGKVRKRAKSCNRPHYILMILMIMSIPL